jgi:hypothetical protein
VEARKLADPQSTVNIQELNDGNRRHWLRQCWPHQVFTALAEPLAHRGTQPTSNLKPIEAIW